MVRIWWLMEGSAVFRESGLFERVGRDGNDLYDGREGFKRPPYWYIGRYKGCMKPYVRSTPFLPLETYRIRRSYYLLLTIHHLDASPMHRVLLPIRLFITRVTILLLLLLVFWGSRSLTGRPTYQIIARIAIRLRMQVL